MKIQDMLRLSRGAVLRDVTTAASTGFVAAAGARRIAAHVITGAGPAGDSTVTVQLRQATDAAGSGAKDLGSAVAVAVAESEFGDQVVETLVEQMDTNNGFTHVAVQVSATDAIDVAATLLRGENRFNP